MLLWLVIFILALVRFSGIKTDWTSTTVVETNRGTSHAESNAKIYNGSVVNTSSDGITLSVTTDTNIFLSSILGYCGIGIHILLSIPILVHLCSGRKSQVNGPFITVCSETLNSWFLIIQVVVTGSDVSLYSMGKVSYKLVGLDLAISFMVILFQAVLRNIEYPSDPETIQRDKNGTSHLREEFLGDDDETTLTQSTDNV